MAEGIESNIAEAKRLNAETAQINRETAALCVASIVITFGALCIALSRLAL